MSVGRSVRACRPVFSTASNSTAPVVSGGAGLGSAVQPCSFAVINRDSTRRTSSTFLEQLVVKAVRAVLRQYGAGLVRTAAFLGLLSEFVVLLPQQALLCNKKTL